MLRAVSAIAMSPRIGDRLGPAGVPPPCRAALFQASEVVWQGPEPGQRRDPVHREEVGCCDGCRIRPTSGQRIKGCRDRLALPTCPAPCQLQFISQGCLHLLNVSRVSSSSPRKTPSGARTGWRCNREVAGSVLHCRARAFLSSVDHLIESRSADQAGGQETRSFRFGCKKLSI